MAPNPSPPRRRLRWYQFSLRTLFVAVTLFSIPCAYVGWQAKIVRERNNLARHIPGFFFYCPDIDNPKVPLLRRWLGDIEYTRFFIDDSEPEETLDRYRAAFPEAAVTRGAGLFRDLNAQLERKP